MLSPRPRDAEKVLRGIFFISWGAERMTADSKLACMVIKRPRDMQHTVNKCVTIINNFITSHNTPYVKFVTLIFNNLQLFTFYDVLFYRAGVKHL